MALRHNMSSFVAKSATIPTVIIVTGLGIAITIVGIPAIVIPAIVIPVVALPLISNPIVSPRLPCFGAILSNMPQILAVKAAGGLCYGAIASVMRGGLAYIALG